jgi:hypothetical protein
MLGVEFCFASAASGRAAFAIPRVAQNENGFPRPHSAWKAKDRRVFIIQAASVKRGGSVATSGPPR